MFDKSQGLSFLAASLLLHMPEEQAFCVLVRVMFHYGLRDLFKVFITPSPQSLNGTHTEGRKEAAVISWKRLCFTRMDAATWYLKGIWSFPFRPLLSLLILTVYVRSGWLPTPTCEGLFTGPWNGPKSSMDSKRFAGNRVNRGSGGQEDD